MSQVDFYDNKLSFEIDSWDLREAQKSDPKVVVLDVRSRASFDKCHIESAISFPHGEMTPAVAHKFNRDTQYVTYCDGVGCNAATTGAKKMAALGFKVRELIGGLTWWREHGYPVEKAVLSQVE